MFDIEIWEVYSLNQEVPEHRETPKRTSEKFMTSEDVTLLHSITGAKSGFSFYCVIARRDHFFDFGKLL